MLNLLQRTKVANRPKFVLACILWLAVCFASALVIDNVYLSAVGTFAIGLFAYWQLDAPMSKSGEDVVGLFVVASSVFLGMLLSMGLSAFLSGGVGKAMQTTLVVVVTVVVIVAIGVGVAYFVLRRQNAPKLSEEAWRKRLRRALVLKSWAWDAWIVAIVAAVVLIVDLVYVVPVKLGIDSWIVLVCVEALGGMFLMVAGILQEKLVGANLFGAFERGEGLSNEETSFIQWEQARTEEAQQSKFWMDATKTTSGVMDDVVTGAVVAAKMSKTPSWKSEKAPFAIRHVVLIAHLLALIIGFCLSA